MPVHGIDAEQTDSQSDTGEKDKSDNEPDADFNVSHDKSPPSRQARNRVQGWAGLFPTYGRFFVQGGADNRLSSGCRRTSLEIGIFFQWILLVFFDTKEIPEKNNQPISEALAMERGRPKKVRLPGSGAKLHAALQLAGLCWGKNGVQPNHVCHNSRWQECDLPRSTNTILEDIHTGIPVDRLNDYASFFNVSPRLFSEVEMEEYSPEFSCEILKNKYIIHSSITEYNNIIDPIYHYAVASNNEVSYVNRLFSRLNGVYDIYIKQSHYNYVQRCVVFIDTMENSCLRFNGKMWYDSIGLTLTGGILRWSTFLHITYYTADCHVLGYMLTPDPLQSLLIEGRDPLCLDLFGLAGSLTSPLIPDRYYGFARQRPRQDAEHMGATYEQACRDLAVQPVIPDSDPAYAALVERIEKVGQAVPSH